jgi:transcriptional regulator with XRE-family HTH domain
MEISGRQIKAARALLGIQMAEVAKRTGLSRPPVIRLEQGLGVQTRTLASVVELLEGMGVEFIPGGVRLREMGEAAE